MKVIKQVNGNFNIIIKDFVYKDLTYNEVKRALFIVHSGNFNEIIESETLGNPLSLYNKITRRLMDLNVSKRDFLHVNIYLFKTLYMNNRIKPVISIHGFCKMINVGTSTIYHAERKIRALLESKDKKILTIINNFKL